MRYVEPTERSFECLRQAVAQMGQHKAAANPLTYAVWYEHVAGLNRTLSAAIGDVIRQGAKLDDASIQSLYELHIADRNSRSVERVRNELHGLLSTLSGSTADTLQSTTSYQEALKGLARELSDQDGPTAESVADVLRQTESVGESVGGLNHKLVQSQRESEALRQELNRIREEALLDGLTGLHNRRALDGALPRLIENCRARNMVLSLVMLDIDHFKKINDTFGHVFGDRVIKAVAQALRSQIKEGDFVGRYGGEEFAVILPGADQANAVAMADRMRSLVEAGRVRRSGSDASVTTVTISAGVAQWVAGDAPEQLIERADAALYAAKRGGRNRVVAAPAKSAAAA